MKIKEEILFANKIKVLYDYQIFWMQDFGGISQSFTSLIQEFLKNKLDIMPEVGCLFSNNHHIRSVLHNRFHKMPHFRGGKRIFKPINQLYSHYLMNHSHLIHSTYYMKDSRIKNIGKPIVTTIHDMIPEIFPEYFKNRNPHMKKREYCNFSNEIVCVSKQTRKDLIYFYNISDEKTHVVYHGIDLDYVQHDVNMMQGVPSDYILYVGKRFGYKNFSMFFEAAQKVMHKHKELHLVCVGGGSFNKKEKLRIYQVDLTNRVHQYSVSDSMLRSLYRRAKAFIYPSKYEGFGLPILEAFAQHCPVILANASCFPEIAGEAAVYFEPSESESCADSIEQVLIDNNQTRIDKGIDRCKEFTWQLATEKLEAIYKKTL